MEQVAGILQLTLNVFLQLVQLFISFMIGAFQIVLEFARTVSSATQ